MKLNVNNWFSKHYLNVLLFSFAIFTSTISTTRTLKNMHEASFVNFFKFEILGVMDGIKGNTDANLWIFGKKIF